SHLNKPICGSQVQLLSPVSCFTDSGMPSRRNSRSLSQANKTAAITPSERKRLFIQFDYTGFYIKITKRPTMALQANSACPNAPYRLFPYKTCGLGCPRYTSRSES